MKASSKVDNDKTYSSPFKEDTEIAAFKAAMRQPWKSVTAKPILKQAQYDPSTDATGLDGVLQRRDARLKRYNSMTQPWLDYLRQELETVRQQKEGTNTSLDEKPTDPRLARQT